MENIRFFIEYLDEIDLLSSIQGQCLLDLSKCLPGRYIVVYYYTCPAKFIVAPVTVLVMTKLQVEMELYVALASGSSMPYRSKPVETVLREARMFLQAQPHNSLIKA